VAVAALLQLAVKALPAATSKTSRAKIIHFSSFYHPHATFFLIPFMAARHK
jgi:glutamate-1-semialdehyde aminotransferase